MAKRTPNKPTKVSKGDKINHVFLGYDLRECPVCGDPCKTGGTAEYITYECTQKHYAASQDEYVVALDFAGTEIRFNVKGFDNPKRERRVKNEIRAAITETLEAAQRILKLDSFRTEDGKFHATKPAAIKWALFLSRHAAFLKAAEDYYNVLDAGPDSSTADIARTLAELMDEVRERFFDPDRPSDDDDE